jgi:uncharacterized protein DUF4280
MQCSFGVAPSSLIVLPTNRVMVNYMPAANIMDYIPMVNILPFGMCSAPTNPAVIAATAAAAGVPTPAPCVPVIPAPWTPGSPGVFIGNMPALNDTSLCLCAWTGVISITFPGQMTTDIP